MLMLSLVPVDEEFVAETPLRGGDAQTKAVEGLQAKG